MKTEYGNMIFLCEGTNKNGSMWECEHLRENYSIGWVRWNEPWKQYCFFPEKGMIFGKVALDDMSHFVDQLNKQKDAIS